MNKLAYAGLALGVCLASPALALEHEVVIPSPAGPIAADYRGSVKVENHGETIRATMLALAEQDRTTLLAEAESVRGGNREG